MPGGSVGDIEGRVDLGRLDPHHQFAGHRVARHIVLFADSARTTLEPFRHPADSRDELVLLSLFRWKVFHVARGDHVRPTWLKLVHTAAANFDERFAEIVR